LRPNKGGSRPLDDFAGAKRQRLGVASPAARQGFALLAKANSPEYFLKKEAMALDILAAWGEGLANWMRI
jgi:hypothetical protein